MSTCRYINLPVPGLPGLLHLPDHVTDWYGPVEVFYRAEKAASPAKVWSLRRYPHNLVGDPAMRLDLFRPETEAHVLRVIDDHYTGEHPGLNMLAAFVRMHATADERATLIACAAARAAHGCSALSFVWLWNSPGQIDLDAVARGGYVLRGADGELEVPWPRIINAVVPVGARA